MLKNKNGYLLAVLLAFSGSAAAENKNENEGIFSAQSLKVTNMSYLAQFVEVGSLSQRMSNLHKSQDGGNVWAHVYTGYLNSFDDSNLDDSKFEYTGGEFGADLIVSSSDTENMAWGILGGYSHGKVSFEEGVKGKTTTYTAGTYVTYKHESGFYADATLKYQRIQNELNGPVEGAFFDGKGSSNGYSVSLETGKRFTAEGGSNLAQVYWFFEPQAQLTYTHQGQATLESGDSTTIFSKYNSLIGRASVLTGYSIIGTDLDVIDLYFKVGYVREFDGATSYRYNGRSSDYHFKGGYFDSAFGVSYEMNRFHSFYLDIGYMQGKLFTNRQINIGYRYYF